MSMIELLSSGEKTTLRRWYKYAKSWGYWTKADGSDGGHSRYEEQLHGLAEYITITAVSDNVFRNVIQFNRDNMLLKYDVIGKADQVDYMLGEEDILCRAGNPGKKLIKDYFKNSAPGFADELEDFDLDQPMSVPFEIIVYSALVLYAIAYLKKGDVTEFVERIIEVRDQYKEEE